MTGFKLILIICFVMSFGNLISQNFSSSTEKIRNIVIIDTIEFEGLFIMDNVDGFGYLIPQNNMGKVKFNFSNKKKFNRFLRKKYKLNYLDLIDLYKLSIECKCIDFKMTEFVVPPKINYWNTLTVYKTEMGSIDFHLLKMKIIKFKITNFNEETIEYYTYLGDRGEI